MRPSLSYQPTEDFLNSRSIVSFDDETKSIRAQTAALLKRIHEPLPRTRRPLPVYEPTYSQYTQHNRVCPLSYVTCGIELHRLYSLPCRKSKILREFRISAPRTYCASSHSYWSPWRRYEELAVPERITSDTYILRMLGSSRSVADEIKSMSYYNDPARRTLGKGHLACVSFAGGRGFPRRRNLVRDPDTSVKDDVTFLSHYERMRDAANGTPHIPQGLTYLPYRMPSKPSRFYKPSFPVPVPPVASAASSAQYVPERKTLSKSLSKEADDVTPRQAQRKKLDQEEERLAEEARKQELARQEELAQQAARERQEALERKAQEDLKKRKEQERLEELEREAEIKRKEAERQAEIERQAEAERQAELARIAEAERLAELERQAEAERQAELERQAEAERQAELERQAEAERLAELERQAEAERQAELERQAEAERQAELERQAEAERQAELERQAEAERIAEEERLAEAERQAEAEKLAEAEKTETEQAEPEASEEPLNQEQTELEEQAQAETETKTDDTEQAGNAEPAETADGNIEDVFPAEDEVRPTVNGEVSDEPEPVVEEPQSPEVGETKRISTEEVASTEEVDGWP